LPDNVTKVLMADEAKTPCGEQLGLEHFPEMQSWTEVYSALIGRLTDAVLQLLQLPCILVDVTFSAFDFQKRLLSPLPSVEGLVGLSLLIFLNRIHLAICCLLKTIDFMLFHASSLNSAFHFLKRVKNE